MDRRRFVSAAGMALTASLSGCLSANQNRDTPTGTQALPVRFWLEEVSLTESEQEDVDPILFGDLSEEEGAIVETVIDEGEYTVEQDSVPTALESLRFRIEERTGNGKTLEVYLKRGTAYYRVGFADGDHIIAHPDH